MKRPKNEPSRLATGLRPSVEEIAYDSELNVVVSRLNLKAGEMPILGVREAGSREYESLLPAIESATGANNIVINSWTLGAPSTVLAVVSRLSGRQQKVSAGIACELVSIGVIRYQLSSREVDVWHDEEPVFARDALSHSGDESVISVGQVDRDGIVRIRLRKLRWSNRTIIDVCDLSELEPPMPQPND